MALSTSYAAIVSRGRAQALVPSTLQDAASSKPLQQQPEDAGTKEEEAGVARRSRPDSEVEAHGEREQQPPVPSHLALRRPRPDNNSKSRKPHQQKFHSYHHAAEINNSHVGAGGEGHPKDPHQHSHGLGGPRSHHNDERSRHRHPHPHRLPPLRTLLREMGCTEAPERDRARSQALAYVEDKLREWVRQLSGARKHQTDGVNREQLTDGATTGDATTSSNNNNNNQENDNEELLVTLIPFGSYRLGVHRPNSDLDCLVLTSAAVTRHDFFSSWVEMLRSDSNVSHVHPIPNAYTPVLKFQIKTGLMDEQSHSNETLQLDLLFASVNSAHKLSEFFERRKQHQQHVTVAASIPASLPPLEYYWIDNRDLPHQDAAGVRSLNGCRVTQIILQLIAGGGGGAAAAANSTSEDSAYLARLRLRRYQEMLCVVKQWAIQAGIYSNALGFLGGVNWAIMAAWVCLTSSEFSEPHRLRSDWIVSTLLRRFFVVFGRWKWPAPVMLTPVEPCPPPELLNSSVTSGAAAAPSNAQAPPPPPPPFNELQPWNPAVNKRDTFHIMPILTPAWPAMNSAYNVGIPHLRRMQDEFRRARDRIQNVPNNRVVPALFDLGDFVKVHRHFLIVTMTTDRSEPADVHKQWCQFLESKLRLLVINLETPEIHPWPYSKFFHNHDDQHYQTYFCLALRFAPHVSKLNLEHLTADWLQRINGWPGRTPSVDLKLEHTVDAMLPACVRDEIARCSRFPRHFRPSSSSDSHHDAAANNEVGGDPPLIQAAGSGDWDSDDNGSRTSDKSYASVASSFSSEVCQQTKRYRGDDSGSGGAMSAVENVPN